MTPLPALRIRRVPNAGTTPCRYVLYWMVGARRLTWNPALDHAIALARQWHLGLVVFEPLRLDYPWASARFHTFVLQGMVDNAAATAEVPGVRYVPYVEPTLGESRGLLEALAAEAAVVVTDDVPGFFQARMVERVAPRLPCPVEVVDGWGVAPLRALIMDLARFGTNPRVHLFFGARYACELYDLRTLWQIAAHNPWLSVTPVAEFPEPVWATDYPDVQPPRGLHVLERGRLPEVVTRYGAWGDRQILICGGPDMVRATRAALIAKGAPPERIQHDPLP